MNVDDISAFPAHMVNQLGAIQTFQSGMTLRDYFASHALVGIMQIPAEELPCVRTICEIIGVAESEYKWWVHFPVYQSWLAYQVADSMIKHRDNLTTTTV